MIKKTFFIFFIFLFILITFWQSKVWYGSKKQRTESIRIKGFSQLSSIEIPNTSYAHGSVSVDDFLFLLTDTSPAKIIKINIHNMKDYLVTTLNEKRGKELVYSKSKDRLYGVFGGRNMCINEINPHTLTEKIIWCVDSHNNDNSPSLATDGKYLYTITTTNPSIIHKIDLKSFKTVSFLSLPKILSYGHAIRYSGGYIFATGENNNGWIAKIDSSTLQVTYKTFDNDVKNPTDDFAVTNKDVFIGFENNSGILYKITKKDLTVKKIYTHIFSPIYSVSADKQYVFVAFASSPGILMIFNESGAMEYKDKLSINEPNEIIEVGNYIFVSSWTDPLNILKSSLQKKKY